MISLLEIKIGRDPTKYILPCFLKNKDDLLNAIRKCDHVWINYFYNVKMIVKDVKYLHAIIDSGNTEYMKLYIGSNWNLGLKHACKGGNMEIVKLMIQKGDKSYPFNWNMGLEYACVGGNIEIVKLMIQKGATNIKAQFDTLIENGHFEILEYLENNGHAVPSDFIARPKG